MNIRGFFTKKKIIWTIIIVVVVGFIVMRVRAGKNSAANILTDTVKMQNLKQTVLATGQVVSSTDLQLSFKSGGNISTINVKEGDKVKAGQILATLEQKDQLASLTQAQGSLAQAQANYEKVLAGASSQDVAVAQSAVDAAQVSVTNAQQTLANTKQQQQVLVANALSALLNSTFAASPATNNVSSAVPTISGAYTGVEQGQYIITIYSTGGGLRFNVSGLEVSDGQVSTISPVPIGTKGLYVQFPTGMLYNNDSWTISIPNTKAASYITNYNAYQAALQSQNSSVATAQAAVSSAQVALTQTQANLNLKIAQARPADIDAAKAQILSAQGQVLAASSNLDHTIIRAPANGTITQVNVKVGEQASPSVGVLILQDVGSLHIEADVSEANIASVQPGQTIDVTFDALGPDRHFNAKVETVNPASTLVSGVVNYKVTASVDNITEIKPGMTANMTILVAQKDNVLSIPSSAVVNNNDGSKTVKVITDDKKKTYNEVKVTTGLEADGGLVEVTSGLSQGQEVVTYIKK